MEAPGMAALVLLAVAGLHVSAGMMASSGPGIGDEPTTGLWVAEDGAKLFADRGPVEHPRVVISSMKLSKRKRRPFENWSWRNPATSARVRRRNRKQRSAGSDRPPACLAAPHSQPFFVIKPLRLILVDHAALLAKQNMQPPIAEAAALGCKFAQPLQSRADFWLRRFSSIMNIANSRPQPVLY
jgi:hypothetical protein